MNHDKWIGISRSIFKWRIDLLIILVYGEFSSLFPFLLSTHIHGVPILYNSEHFMAFLWGSYTQNRDKNNEEENLNI